MNKYDLVLFDLDGTIANSDEMVVRSFQELYRLYGDGRELTREECYYFSGPTLDKSFAKLFPNGDFDLLFKEFYRISKPLYEEVIVPYPHSKEVLLDFKKRGIKLGIITNKKHDMSVYCLQIIGLLDLFDIVVGYEDVKERKPAPDGILLAMDKFHIKDKSRVLYVGDNPSDIETGHNADVDMCFTAWGPRKFNLSLLPKYTIYDYLELKEIVIDEN